jgi:hypothetical protein
LRAPSLRTKKYAVRGWIILISMLGFGLAPSPYEPAPGELAPDPYGSSAPLAPDPYLDGHDARARPARASLPQGSLGLQRRAAGGSARFRLAPSPYDLVSAAALAPSPY